MAAMFRVVNCVADCVWLAQTAAHRKLDRRRDDLTRSAEAAELDVAWVLAQL
jgi:hypothetical protein